jgi:hypothetical protein
MMRSNGRVSGLALKISIGSSPLSLDVGIGFMAILSSLFFEPAIAPITKFLC